MARAEIENIVPPPRAVPFQGSDERHRIAGICGEIRPKLGCCRCDRGGQGVGDGLWFAMCGGRVHGDFGRSLVFARPGRRRWPGASLARTWVRLSPR